jgi:hypothetical protein
MIVCYTYRAIDGTPIPQAQLAVDPIWVIHYIQKQFEDSATPLTGDFRIIKRRGDALVAIAEWEARLKRTPKKQIGLRFTIEQLIQTLTTGALDLQ